MRTRSSILVAAALLGATAGTAHAAPALRLQVDQHGDFILIGNTLGYECAAGTPAPVVGTIANNACSSQSNNNQNDSSPDLFWQSNNPANGATASTAITAAQARSTAVLAVPAGATVTHAFLYWAASAPTNAATTQVTLDRVGGFSQQVTALQTFLPNTNNTYQAVADITALVQANGSGAYRVSGIAPAAFANVNNNNLFGGWSMVVFYQRAADPLRNLAIFDGLDMVSNGNNQSATLSGFLVPTVGFTGKLGVIAYEGDNSIDGDRLFFNGGAALSDAQNPINNFFNATRSNLGAAVSVAGDLPQLTGGAQSMGGMDLDIVDVTAKLTGGQTSATVEATSTGDTYYLGAFITSISTFKPDFNTSTKTVVDVNGGSLLAGDTLQYTINVVNTGNDTSINTVLVDTLPTGVTYVPNSLSISSGPNAGAKTDATGDDQGDYNAATRTVTVRLGTGANATTGGTLPIDGTSVVTFQVKINAGYSGSLQNQANISAGGLLGAPNATTPTDGNGPVAGAPPTTVIVDECESNAACGVPTPVCDTTASPKVCVACLADSDCGGVMSGKVCDPTHTCIDGCHPTGNGCPNPLFCTSTDATIGQCVECLGDSDCGGPTSGKVCDPSTDKCVDGCHPTGNGCPVGDACTSTDATIGQCVDCLQDSDCGGAMSGKVCDTTKSTCIDGCHTPGNGCPNGQECSSTDATIGICVECLQDSDCGGPGSGKVCDTNTSKCIDGCKGTNEGDCPQGEVCTSMDTTIGQCVECLTDTDCGDANSGKVCDTSTSTCVDGCHTPGNGCPDGQPCTSMDAPIGQCAECLTDTDCGDATSGKVCDDGTKKCTDGCRGSDGNGCPTDKHCTSKDATIGQCVSCIQDSDCGGANSGKVCDEATHTCTDGCRGNGGNGCPDGQQCSSTTTTVGTCTGGTGGAGGGDADGVVPEGNGIHCSATPRSGDDTSAGWLFGAALAALAATMRRRRK